MGNKIKEIKPNKHFKNIRDFLKSDIQSAMHFSFKHLDINHNKFSVNERNNKYFKKIFERLKNLSTMNIREVQNNRTKSLRVHTINWEDTTEPQGFSQLHDQLQQITAYQFEISANEHGRVHGFFIENVFFIVWFDPDHKLYN